MILMTFPSFGHIWIFGGETGNHSQASGEVCGVVEAGHSLIALQDMQHEI